MPHPAQSVLAIMFVGVLSARAHAQADDPLPLIAASQQELIQSLDGPIGNHQSLALALVAAQPTVSSEALINVMHDRSLAENIRANALRTLAFFMDSAATRAALDVARQPGPMQEIAWATLQTFQSPEVCSFWREALTSTESEPRPASHYAFAGISFCGTEADIELLRRNAGRAGLSIQESVEEFYVPRLRLAAASRYDGTLLEGSRPSTGEYTLPDQARARVNAALCQGPCPAGMRLSPGDLQRIRVLDAHTHTH